VNAVAPQIGDVVKVVDEQGHHHNALVCANWNYEGSDTPSLNVVFVSDDDSKVDSYGRQIDRHLTSVVHRSSQSAPGRYWYLPD
jgi:hypothetical protein